MIPKVVSEKTKYNGKWFEIVEQKVDLGNGKTAFWEMFKSSDAVATIALDNKNNVYLGREFKAAHKGFIYTTAAGIAERQDSEKTLKEQARKELREEFGFNAKKIEKLATVLQNGRSTPKWHIFMAQELYNDPLEKDEGETIEVIKLPINGALKLLLSNKSHFVALLGILLVKEKLGL
ncbi:MAG: NUDIX hydrolase [Candidatus Aenigmarchaeota archaeon]|nr:NUDIX hydrolase [Candidatus Aenigmarchaeota archaeon]